MPGQHSSDILAVAKRLSELAQQYELSCQAIDRLASLLEQLAQPHAPSSVKNPLEGIDIHIADSLTALAIPEVKEAKLIADIGAGAGLPGLVLGTVIPTAKVVEVESTLRKCEFIVKTTDALDITNVTVACTRVELWEDGLDSCDVVCARALAEVGVLCEYAAPLMRVGGILVAWKGTVSKEEELGGTRAAEILGLEPVQSLTVEPYKGSRHRELRIFVKRRPTPPEFPRRPGMASKKPLSKRS